MSTKIYSGVRFVSSDLVTIHEHFMEWRKRIAELTRQKTVEWMVRHALQEVDWKIACGQEPTPGALYDGLLKLWDAQDAVKKTQHRNPAVDFEFSVSILPWQAHVYGVVYSVQREWTDEFMALPWVEQYAYWNNSDPPEEISQEDWDDRGAIWKFIMAQDPWDRPVGCGFTVECHSAEFDHPPAEDLIGAIPDLETRARKAAANLVADRVAREFLNGLPEEDRADNHWRAVRAAGDHLLTEAGRVEIAQESDRLRPLLPQSPDEYVRSKVS